MTLEERLEALAAFTDTMFRRHAEEFERHKHLIQELDQRITRRIDALSEVTARRLDAQDQDLQRHNEAMAKLDARLARMTALIEEHDTRLDRIEKLVERFIQGQARDGHKPESDA
jgi:septal ring factor EnvC (AmiA/AmiB activator)